jgi:hypothetical protein
MSATSRKEIFTQAARKLRQDFEELVAVPHNAAKGGEAERLVRAFLSQRIPKRFDVGAGFIIDPRDAISRQSDVIIYDAINCPVYRASEEAGIYPSDNVAAVVEVKSRLTKDKLREAFENIHSTKSLCKTGEEAPGPLRTQTYAAIFAFNSDIAPDTISQTYSDLLTEFPLGAHPDLMLVLDRAVFSLACKPRGFSEWAPMSIEGFGGEAGEGTHVAIGYLAVKEEGLDIFFRLLLANLILFREHVPHPGFKWEDITGTSPEFHLRYLTSFTTATEVEERARRLRQYGNEVRREFESRKQSSGVTLQSSGGTIVLPDASELDRYGKG